MDRVTKPSVLSEFEKITIDWDHAPKWVARKTIRPDYIKVTVFPSGPNRKIWHFVSRGTKRHKIETKNAPSLVFPWGGKGSYKPKTKPGRPPSFGGPGEVTNPEIKRLQEVDHPGNEGRFFEEAISKEEFKKLRVVVNDAIREGVNNAHRKKS
jgi:hypothetical protein